MSAPTKSTPSASAARRPTKGVSTPQTAESRSPSRTDGRSATPSTVSRTSSVRKSVIGTPVSARAAVRKPMSGSSNATNARNGSDADAVADDDDTKGQSHMIIEELQERLQKAELAAEEQQKQNTLLQSRLDDALNDTSKFEEQLHELNERTEELHVQNKDITRQKRELENIYEAEKSVILKDREAFQAREVELADSIQRLKETLAQREIRSAVDEERKPGLSRNPSFRAGSSPTLDSGHFAPSSSLQRSDSRSSSRLVLQKDKIIEELRLELAGAQIKIMEMENMGGGQVQELERTLMETKIANARLIEDNESYQLLLSEKTLNGDLINADLLRSTSPTQMNTQHGQGSSLADELEDANANTDDNHKRFQLEIASLKDQNKALTVYINNIISQMMASSEFEKFLEKNNNVMGPPARPVSRSRDKELPPPPPEKDDSNGSLLSRTRSMLGGRSRPRPTSSIFQRSENSQMPTAHENPTTAPSIPLSRPQQRSVSGGHRRTNSNAGMTVNPVSYRSQSPNGQLSPPLISPRSSFSVAPTGRPTVGNRIPSVTSIPTISESEKGERRANRDSKISSSRNSVASDQDASNASSPPRNTVNGGDKAASAVMMGSKPRPLRLVQNAAEQDQAAKKNNRSSWYGWFNKSGEVAS